MNISFTLLEKLYSQTQYNLKIIEFDLVIDTHNVSMY